MFLYVCGLNGKLVNNCTVRYFLYLQSIIICFVGIQARCETVLARLAEASCGDYFTERKLKASHHTGSLQLHAAHVLSMDALLATGLELGAHAPKCWSHVFR